MRKGICCAGNMIVDITYPIETWPRQNELTHITEGIQSSTGGCVCNTITDLARLDPGLPLMASGFAGHDAEGDFILAELGKYPNIDLSMVRRDGRTSFTAVMSNNQTKERTFFQHAGANAHYCEAQIDWERLDVDIFHIGYILLLPALDAEDPEYGTRMARLLHRVQEIGIRTSIDVVSETGDRFARLVTPHVFSSVLAFVTWGLLASAFPTFGMDASNGAFWTSSCKGPSTPITFEYLGLQLLFGTTRTLGSQMWFQSVLIILTGLFAVFFRLVKPRFVAGALASVFLCAVMAEYSGLNRWLFEGFRYEI